MSSVLTPTSIIKSGDITSPRKIVSISRACYLTDSSPNMSLQAGQDIPVRVFVPADSTSNSTLISAERRISPSWTVGQLKTKLEPVTGIPPSCQRLRTKHPLQSWVVLDDDESLVGSIRWSLKRESEIEVSITVSSRTCSPNLCKFTAKLGN